MPLDIAIEYLRTQGPDFSRHVAFMSQFPHLRPSDAKKQEEVQVWNVHAMSHPHSPHHPFLYPNQAMTINSRMHSMHLIRKDGSASEVAMYLRRCVGCVNRGATGNSGKGVMQAPSISIQ